MSKIVVLTGLLLLLTSIAVGADTKNGFDLQDALIPSSEIHHGGPPKDGIPSIDHPAFVAAQQVNFLEPNDRVIGVAYNGEIKAYPVAILNWHEIVNDRYKGERVVVSFCPLCGTGVVFSTHNKKARTFGVSGLLYNSDLLLYDRETQSLWSQISGEAISGSQKGARFDLIPATHTSWSAWKQRYPNTKVLSEDTGYRRNYDRDPYAGYETREGLFFSVENMDPRFHPKARVEGLIINGVAKAYPHSELDKSKSAVQDVVGSVPVEIHFDEDGQSVEIYNADGKRLPSLSSFWFAWYAFHPDTEVYKAP